MAGHVAFWINGHDLSQLVQFFFIKNDSNGHDLTTKLIKKTIGHAKTSQELKLVPITTQRTESEQEIYNTHSFERGQTQYSNGVDLPQYEKQPFIRVIVTEKFVHLSVETVQVYRLNDFT